MAWDLIDSLDAPSGGTFIFDPLDFTGYSIAQIVLTGITVTTDGTDLVLTFYVGGAEIVTGYRWANTGSLAGGSDIDDGDTSDPSIRLNSNDAGRDVGNAAGEGYDCIITVDEPLNTSHYKKARLEAAMTTPTGALLPSLGTGIMENTGAINGLKIAGSSSLTAGKVRILGWA
jgi:hypothetical protein